MRFSIAQFERYRGYVLCQYCRRNQQDDVRITDATAAELASRHRCRFGKTQKGKREPGNQGTRIDICQNSEESYSM